MARRSFLRTAGAAAAGAIAGGAAPYGAPTQARRPNVLFIAVDDLRPALGCYGNSLVHSPNIDALARRGVRFERACCQYPLCNPSRTSLLSGRYPTTTGVVDNLRNFRAEFPDMVTLPQLFRANGYVTARTGKIFHGGIDDPEAWTEGGEPPQPRRPRTPDEAVKYRETSDRWVAVEGAGHDLPDYRTASRALELAEKYKDRPLFLAVGFVKPHSAPIAPKQYFDLYDSARLPLPVDFAPRPTVGPGVPDVALPARNGDLFVGRDAEPNAAREMIRAYYACVSWMDAQVGRVLDGLGRLKLLDNTAVVLFGDHGYHLGEKGKWSKHGSLYEVAARVPLLISHHGFGSNGQTCGRTVELVDLYPTVAELGGLALPKGLEGQSLVPLLKDPKARWEHPAYTMAQRGNRLGVSVRTERFRYTQWDEAGEKAELYDHDADPHELRNLAGDPKNAATVKTLAALFRKLPNWPWKAAKAAATAATGPRA